MMTKHCLNRRKLAKSFYFGCVVCISFTLFHCDTLNIRKQKSTVLAKVNNAILTIDDLNASIPKEMVGKISQKQKIAFVKQWVDNELLYQAALKNKIDKEKIIRNRLEKIRKDLLSAEMISRNTVAATPQSISESQIQEYYTQNKESFIRESDVVKYLEIIVENMRDGWHVRNMLLPEKFREIGSQYSIVPLPDSSKTSYIPVKNLAPEISTVLPTMKTRGITNPLQLPDGVHIFFLIDKQKAGDLSTIDEVKSEIIDILITQLQKKHIDDLLSDLKQKSHVEIQYEYVQNTQNNFSTEDAKPSTTANSEQIIQKDTIKKDSLRK